MSVETEVLEPTAAVEETGETAEVPGGPDATAVPPASGVEPEPAGQEPVASARPRGPDGRFIKADGTEASVAEQAVMEAALPTPPPPPPTAPTPFVFRADGQKIPIPGSTVAPDGSLTIPADQVPQIRQLLSEGVTHRGSWRKERESFQRQVTDATAAEKAQTEKYHRVGTRMFEAITNPEWLKMASEDPREVQHFIRELGLEMKEANLTVPKQPAERAPDAGTAQAELQTAARDTLAEYVEELLDTPQGKAAYPTAKDRQEVVARYARRMAAYFVDQQGDVALHENAVDADFQDELQWRHSARDAALKATKAAEFNAKRNQPNAAPPPVVSAKGPGSTGSSGARTFKDAEEYKRAVGMA